MSSAQMWEVKKEPNKRRMAIQLDSTSVTDFVYSEISELSENKAYVAKGDLYAYVDSEANELTPYIFTQVSNFTNGYAIVGDSFHQSILNEKMQMLLPLSFYEVRLPKHGLIVVQSDEGLWGVYDLMGHEKLPPVYDLPPKILNRETILVRKNELYGVVNDCNEVVHSINFQYITSAGLGYKQGKYLRLF